MCVRNHTFSPASLQSTWRVNALWQISYRSCSARISFRSSSCL